MFMIVFLAFAQFAYLIFGPFVSIACVIKIVNDIADFRFFIGQGFQYIDKRLLHSIQADPG